MGTVAVSVRRWRTAAVAGLLCSALLAGCSDDDPEPIVADPPASPSASSSSASASAAPEPWQVRSKAGAVAFVEHWVEVLNGASRSGDVTRFREVSSPGCESCIALAERITALYEQGGRINGDGWQVEQAAVTAGSSNSRPVLAVRIDQPFQVVQFANGKTERYPASASTFEAALLWRTGRWEMRRLEIVA